MQICPFFGNLCNLSYTKRNPQWTSIGNLPPITVPCVSLTMIMWSSLKTWAKKVKNFSNWLILNNSYLMTYGTGIWILTDQKKCLGKKKTLEKKNQSFFFFAFELSIDSFLFQWRDYSQILWTTFWRWHSQALWNLSRWL